MTKMEITLGIALVLALIVIIDLVEISETYRWKYGLSCGPFPTADFPKEPLGEIVDVQPVNKTAKEK